MNAPYDQDIESFNQGINAYNQGCDCLNKGDYDNAFRFFLEGAKAGLPAAMNNVSVCYALGNGTPAHPLNAFLWMKRAAEDGFDPSYYSLAAKYFNGDGTARDLHAALQWAQKAAMVNGNNQQAARELAAQINTLLPTEGVAETAYKQGMDALNKKRYNECYPYFRKAADMGYAPAMAKVSTCYACGYGVAEDQRESFLWMNRAADGGDKQAHYIMAVKHFNGKGTPKNLEQAELWLNKLLELSPNHRQGLELQMKINQAKALAAKQQEQSERCLPETDPAYRKQFSDEVIGMYRHGLDLYNAKNYEAALEVLEPAARQGHPESLYLIGLAWFNGNGVERNFNHAVKFMTEAAYRGYDFAARQLATLYTHTVNTALWKAYAQDLGMKDCGDHFTKGMIDARNDTSGAVSAASNHDAMLIVGEYLENEKRGRYRNEPNLGKGALAASRYAEKAVLFGNLDAACAVGDFLRTGNPERSSTFYRIAAYMGHSYAMYQLGQYYDKINYYAANACYRQAALWGYRPAADECAQRALQL